MGDHLMLVNNSDLLGSLSKNCTVLYLGRGA